jgi:hypothetical protein
MHKKRQTNRQTKRQGRKNKYHKGGSNNSLGFLEPPQQIEVPLEFGASNPAEEAFLRQQHMNQNQQNILDGEPPISSSENQTGGSSNGIVVPQIQTSLPSQPNDPNNLSVELNKTLTQQGANAVMDGCVGQGDSCTVQNHWDGKGGKKKIRNKSRTSKSRTSKSRTSKSRTSKSRTSKSRRNKKSRTSKSRRNKSRNNTK